MMRRILLASLIAVPLSCSSSNVQSEVAPPTDASSAQASTMETHRVIYVVQCLTPVRREGLVEVRDCEFEVSYRMEEGMRFERTKSSWRYEFICASGEAAEVTAERRGWTHGRFLVSITVDNRRTRAFLEEGDAGPVTLMVDTP